MRQHLSFRNFKPEVLTATEELFAAKPWQESIEAEGKVVLAQDWLNKCSAIYGLPPVEYILNTEGGLREGTFYEPQYGDGPDEIRASKFSLVNLFSAFAAHRGEHTQAKAGQNPVGWGCSLFYRVRPTMFRARVREGRIFGVTPQDLLTSETLQQVRDAGLDPHDKDVLSQLARINAGEDRDFASVEEMSASDEEAALEALDDVDDSVSDDVISSDSPLPVRPDLMNTRELRRHATAQGLSGVWSMSKTEILAALERQELIAAGRGPEGDEGE